MTSRFDGAAKRQKTSASSSAPDLGDPEQCQDSLLPDSAPILIDDSDRNCEMCHGSGNVEGLGACPICVSEVQFIESSDAMLASQDSTASSSQASKMLRFDMGKQCEICRGSRKVIGYGRCPQCLPEKRSCSSQSHMEADHKIAELLTTEEAGKQQIQALILELDALKAQAAASCSNLWYRLATIDEDVSDEDKVRAFFQQRQQGNPQLEIQQCTKVENNRLQAFAPQEGNRPTLIFHGSPEKNWGNIMTEGLLMSPEFCGRCGGIFGAMNPLTSLGYARKGGDERLFMALCVYDLPLGGAAPQPGAAYSVPREECATVLWLLKVSSK